MSAPPVIADLVERFDQQSDAYKSGQYNEAQLRKEFVDPMFKALGWDMENISGYAEAYKDVIHEDAIKIGGATKAPDYCFRIGGTRKFFLEAKKPSVDIKSDAHPAFQLRRYAWSAKLPLSVLTDFEEFAAYDCRVKPALSDNAATARVLYLQFREFISRWDEIEKIFSRESILKGSFDKFAESTKAKRGTAEVDDAFLDEIEKWRADLAGNLALRNPALSQRDLNFAVQRTIDRIVFLRICEDRRIEVYGRLMALLNGEHTYTRLQRLFREADERYNSGLFHFQKKKIASNRRTISRRGSRSTMPFSRKSSGGSTIQKVRTNFPSCPQIFSGKFTNNFWAKSFDLPKAIAPKSKTNRRLRKRAASITRPLTLSITSSKTPSANCSKTKRRNGPPSFAFSIRRAVPAPF